MTHLVNPDTWWKKKTNNYYHGSPNYCHVIRVLLDEGQVFIVKEHWDRANRHSPKFESSAKREAFLVEWEPCDFAEVPSNWGTYLPAHHQQQTLRPIMRNGSSPWSRYVPQELVEEYRNILYGTISARYNPCNEVRLKKERKKTGFGKFMEKHGL